MTIVVWKFLPKNTQITHFLVSNLTIFVNSQNFAIRPFRECWLQIWQYFFKILAQKYPNQAFLVPNLGIFIFSQDFVIRKIRGCWFQIWRYCFQIPVQKYPNQLFLVPNLRIFYFCTKLCNKTNSRMLISIFFFLFFSNFSPKIPK